MTTQTIKKVALLFSLAISLSACSLITKVPPKQKLEPQPVNVNTNINATINLGDQALPNITQQIANQSAIKKFTDYSELKKFLAENSTNQSMMGGLPMMGGMGGSGGIRRDMIKTEEMAPVGEMPNAAGLTAEPANTKTGGTDYSQTNIQVTGVDEADIVKTDGKYIYTVSKNNIFIVDAFPADSADVLSQIRLKSTPQDIYIKGDSLIVFGYDNTSQDSNSELYKILPPTRIYNGYTFFKVFDISDKKNPKQVRDLDFEGNYTNSRLIDNYVYFVTSKYSYNYSEDETPLPLIIEDNKILTNDSSQPRCNCPAVYYFNLPYQNYNFTSVSAINIAENTQPVNNEVYLMDNTQNMYVSPDNIYITYTKYLNEQTLVIEVTKETIVPLLPDKDKEKIAKIENAENYILSRDEKAYKVANILSRYLYSLPKAEQEKLQKELETKIKQRYQDIAKELEKTVIHKIAINNGNLKYQTTGEVTGQVLNQFAMDESGNYFRIATTKNQIWSQFANDEQKQPYSNLYVLDQDLKQVGAVENLATGERIYSVRFMQNRAYLITFKQTDPLFVVDLTEPTAPKILGELKIPGFSNYLHPYDETTLIGLGRETTTNEWGGVTNQGIKISLYDVANVAEPKEIAKYTIGDQNSYSTALDDHKAFLFSAEKNLLAIPVTKESGVSILPMPMIKCQAGTKCIEPLNQSLDTSFQASFHGLMVFDINKKEIKLKGQIEHPKNQPSLPYGQDYYDTTVLRGLYINDVLYTVSNKYLQANNLTDLKLIKNLELKKTKAGAEDDFEVIN